MTSWHKDQRLVDEGARCDNCKWSEPTDLMNTSVYAPNMFYCHFNPPVHNSFPKVYVSDYCSEFVKKIRGEKK